MNEELDKVVKENNCVPGINYISDNLDKDTRIIYEIYFKNEKEYKVVGSWYTKDNKLDKYSQEIYDELMSQGLCESGCRFIALDVKNKEEHDKMMEYLISCRDKTVSYTELWREKNKIVKFDTNIANIIDEKEIKQ